MDHATEVLLGLFVVFVAAQVGAELAQRCKLPAVVGEIAAGCVIGPSVLGWVHVTEPLEVLAEIGAILLLFSVGLETRLDDLKRVGRVAILVGIAGVILPFALGSAWAIAAGFNTPKAMFVGAAFVATSAGITARVLQEMGALNRLEGRVILGAAVIDDILAMLLLGVVTSLQAGSVDLLQLLLVLAQAIGFVVIVAVIGGRIMRRSSDILEAPINPLSPLTIVLAICLGLAVVASVIGLAAIIGAFLAGMIAAETKQRHSLEKQVVPIMALIVPFFFVVTGTQVNLSELANPTAIGALAIVVVLAVIGKVAGAGLGALSLGKQSALVIGMGMVPRGEVGIIVASLGQQAGLFDGMTYALIIAMSLLTSIIAPPLLGKLIARLPPNTPSSDADPGDTSLLIPIEETGHGPSSSA